MTSDDIAFWSMIGSCASAVATFSATIVGALALTSWRKQDRAKSRQEIKGTLIRYTYQLIDFPLRKDDINYNNKAVILNKMFGDCLEKVILCEDKKFLKKHFGKRFEKFVEKHQQYLKTGEGEKELKEIVDELSTIKYDL